MGARRVDLPRAARAVLLGLTGAAGIATIMATSVATGPFRSTGESFLMVYSAGGQNPRYRVSQTGLFWRDAGVERVPRPVRVTFGKGGHVSVAATQDGRWLAAFMRSDGRIGLRWIDRETGQLIGPNLTPAASAFTGGRLPAVTVFGDRVVLAWLRGEGPRHELVTATGALQEGGIDFDEPAPFRQGRLSNAFDGLDGHPSYKDGFLSGPALSHGPSGTFQMVVVRETWEEVQAQRRGEDSRVRYRVAVYESDDGREWVSSYVPIHDSELPVGPDSSVAIAGFTDGTTVVATVIGDPGRPARVAAVRSCNDGIWHELDARAVFEGAPANDHPFALMSIGEPALPGPGEYYDCVEN